jgi:hypothetical protein
VTDGVFLFDGLQLCRLKILLPSGVGHPLLLLSYRSLAFFPTTVLAVILAALGAV